MARSRSPAKVVASTIRPFNLTGKVALITGGNGGIGLGRDQRLTTADSDGVIWGPNGAKNAAARQTLEEQCGRVGSAPVYVSNVATVIATIGDSMRLFGMLIFFAANAGTIVLDCGHAASSL